MTEQMSWGFKNAFKNLDEAKKAPSSVNRYKWLLYSRVERFIKTESALLAKLTKKYKKYYTADKKRASRSTSKRKGSKRVSRKVSRKSTSRRKTSRK